LIAEFTQNDKEISDGLKRWWQQHSELPPERQPMANRYTPEEQAFMNEALAAFRRA
jgi:hypothetical protein